MSWAHGYCVIVGPGRSIAPAVSKVGSSPRELALVASCGACALHFESRTLHVVAHTAQHYCHSAAAEVLALVVSWHIMAHHVHGSY